MMGGTGLDVLGLDQLVTNRQELGKKILMDKVIDLYTFWPVP